MRIDGEKPQALLSAAMAAALGVSTVGCRAPANLEPAQPAVATATTAFLPDICLTPSELLRSPSLSRESVITYPSGVVINQEGSMVNLAVNIAHLERLDNEPALGLNFPGHIKIIYFFAGSLYRPDAEEQVNLFFQTHRRYLLARYCQEQGRRSDNLLVIALSVADASAETKSRDADELARVLAENYIQGTRILIGDPIGRIPRELPQEILDRALSEGLPFSILRWYN